MYEEFDKHIAASAITQKSMVRKEVDLHHNNVLTQAAGCKQGQGGRSLDTRWLKHCTIEEVYEGYRNWTFPDNAARSTFFRVWQSWQSTLRIMAPTHHGKCDTCQKIKAYLRQLADPEHRRKLKDIHRGHISDVKQDRLVRRRGGGK